MERSCRSWRKKMREAVIRKRGEKMCKKKKKKKEKTGMY
jgi:hypothetical protein